MNEQIKQAMTLFLIKKTKNDCNIFFIINILIYFSYV